MIASLAVVIWFLGLYLIRPQPNDLKEVMPSRLSSFRKIQATFWLGVTLILIFYISTGFSFYQIDDELLYTFGVNNIEFPSFKWLFQIFTHSFFHLNVFHLLANLSILGLLSLYERRVGGQRFLFIFLISTTLSSISVMFYTDDIVVVGASGGILGLAAAYFVDNPYAKTKDYLIGTIGVFVIYFLLQLNANEEATQDYNVDEYGHILGILFATVFCRWFPRKIES